MSTFKFIGFMENKSDPCLLSKCIQYVILMIGIYLDDYLVIGKLTQIKELIVRLKEIGFNLKIENHFTNYLSCQLIENTE
jgi:hypothetical protein